MAEDVELLRQKAMLLVRRERELHSLRSRHDAALALLRVTQGLARERLAPGASPAAIYGRCAQALVDELNYQCVTMLERRGGRWGVAAAVGGAPDARALAGDDVARAVAARPEGVFNDGGDEGAAPLAAALGLRRFLWYTSGADGEAPMLLAAGYDAERAPFFFAFDADDLTFFKMVGQHLDAVLGNLRLVEALAAERAALLDLSRSLDRRVRERTEELTRALRALEEKDAHITSDLERAREFQRAMLAPLPPPGELRFGAVYRPASGVGGDVYDVARVRDGVHRVFLADVTGHGIQAALRTAVLKCEYDLATAAARSPEEALARLNRALVARHPDLDLLSTACCVDLEERDGGVTARVACAAHPPPLLARGAGAEEVEASGAFLGARAEIRLRATSVPLLPGDRLLIFSDGLCEVPGFELGPAARAVGAEGRALDDALAALVARAEAAGGAAGPGDDMTIIGVERGTRERPARARA
ncbi:MAG TPA: PP2C family protein-serine/threonine phosphatase [Polyangiaceae bacterium]|nr:PP2C family protein-serine/threonine phosphatase [Polyangiaceae bacterium]